MTLLSVQERYDLLVDTVSRCGTSVCSRTDDELAYDLFEECDIGIHSYLHNTNLKALQEAGFIDGTVVDTCLEMRKRWMALTQRDWEAGQVKSNQEWREFFKMSDRVMAMFSSK